MKNRLLVLSVDAMVWEDMERLIREEPAFAEMFGQGSAVRKVRSIYPTVTYPCHTTMVTGCYPDKHGLYNNSIFCPGTVNGDWNWFHAPVRTKDIFTVASEAGLKTASLFWPVTAGHPYIDYNIPEYWPQSETDTKKAAFLRGGTSAELWEEVADRYIHGFRIRVHPETDAFLVNCACDIIEKYRPEVLMLHTGDVDHYRHRNGVWSEKVYDGVKDNFRWFCQMIEVSKRAGTYEETNFFMVSDHGQLDIDRIVRLNVLLREEGLIRVDGQGNFLDWDAYVHSTALSAQVHLKHPEDREIYERTYSLLNRLCEEGKYGISKVLTREEAESRDHLSGDFSFVLDSDGHSSFSEEWNGPLVQEQDQTDYRFGAATHGHYPDLGPQPVFFGFGPAIKSGVYLDKANLVDEAPTYAQILGLSLPEADGRVLTELLK